MIGACFTLYFVTITHNFVKHHGSKNVTFAVIFESMAAKFLHIILALSVLFSTTGFTLSKHFCQEELQDMSMFAKAENCQHSQTAPCQTGSHHCDSHGDKEHKGCCNNTAKYYKLDQEKQAQSFEYKSLKVPVLLAAVLVVFNIELPADDNYFLTYQTYKPPIVCDDFQSMLQTFRL